MDTDLLFPGEVYTMLDGRKVCFYDDADCIMPEGIDLQEGMDLTYVGPDAEDGYVFLTDEAVKVCLHLDDLDYINVAA
jgi:hypothetical protein